jgi:D-arabinose 1-dehydrogenase-like Zn-dependent alcohol dehydrogenase
MRHDQDIPRHRSFVPRRSRTVRGTFIGTAVDSEDTLRFSARQRVRPVIETVSLEQAPEAHAKMMKNAARFRMVIRFG